MTTLNRTLSNLDPGKRYIIRVRAKNKLGVVSEWSESIAFEPQESGLDIDDVQFKVTSGVRLIVAEWKTQEDIDLDHYELHVSTEDDFSYDENTLYSKPKRGTLTAIYKAWDGADLSPLEPNTLYHVQLWAVDVDGVYTQIGEELDVTTAAGDTKLDPVEMITADQITAGTITSGVVVSGQIQTATSGSRVVLGNYIDDKIGMGAFNNDDEMVLEFDTDTGRLFVAGRIESGYGPNLIDNSDFETNVDGWAADIGGKMWLFRPDALTADERTEDWIVAGSVSDIDASDVTISHTSNVDEVLFGDDGSLKLTVDAGGGDGNNLAWRSPSPGENIVYAAPVAAGDTHSATCRMHSVAGDRNARLFITWYTAGSSVIDRDFAPEFSVIDNTTDEWCEITIADVVAPATSAYAAVGVEIEGGSGDLRPHNGDEYLIAYAAIETNNLGGVTRDTTEVPDGALKLTADVESSPDPSPYTPSTPGVSLVHTPPGKTADNSDGLGSPIPVEEGESYNVRMKFFIDQGTITFLPQEYINRIIVVMFMYSDTRFVSMQFGSGFSDAASTSELTTASEVFEIPEGVTGVRIGAGFVAVSEDDYIILDDVQLRKSSVITSSIFRAGEIDEPRIEINASSHPSIHFHPTGRAIDYPGEIRAAADTLEILSPRSATGNVRRAGLKLMAGKTVGAKFPPTWVFDAWPPSFFLRKTNTQSVAHDTVEKLLFPADAVIYDPLELYDLDDDVFTVPEGMGGAWILYADASWDSGRLDAGLRRLILDRGGTTLRMLSSITNYGHDGDGSPARIFENGGMTMANLEEGNELTLEVYQNVNVDYPAGPSSLSVIDAHFGAIYFGGGSGN